MANARPPAVSNASMPCAPCSSAKPCRPSPADATASSVPLSCTRISCTPWSFRDATAAYVRPPISKKSEAWALRSLSKPFWPSAADPAAAIVPLSSIRTSCACPCWPPSGVTSASVPLPSAALRTDTWMASSRRARPSSAFVAEATGSRVPFSWLTWISWTPSSTNDATRAMIVPFAVRKAATPPAPLSARSPPAPSSVRLPSGCRVPPSCTRISCTPRSAAEAARANAVPLGARNASTARAFASASVPASSVRLPSGCRVPFSGCIRISCTPWSLNAAAMAYVPLSSPMRNASTAMAPPSARVVALSWSRPSGCRAPFSRTRTSCTPLSAVDATTACVPFSVSNAATPWARSSSSVPLLASEPAAASTGTGPPWTSMARDPARNAGSGSRIASLPARSRIAQPPPPPPGDRAAAPARSSEAASSPGCTEYRNNSSAVPPPFA